MNPYLSGGRPNPNFIGGVAERHESPREFWSREAWAAEDALHAPLYTEPTSPPLAPIATGFTLFPSRTTARDARGRAIDRLLEKHLGLGGRRRR